MVSNKRSPTSKPASKAEPSSALSKPSPFLAAPLEVRAQIFDELLPYPVSNHINLLCVCKELRNEVQKYIYKRPVAFLSQDAFFEWIEKHDEDLRRANLHHVHTLKLKILDIGPDEMQEYWMRTAFQGVDSNQSILNIDENPYRLELERIVSGLQMMPNIMDFTVFKPTENEHSPTCDVYEAIFRFVKSSYPQLRKLTLYLDKMPLTFLPPLKNLRSLRFTGFSVSSPEDTLEYLGKLPNLEELSLCGPPPGLSWRQRTGYKGDMIVQSITPEVLKKLRPLKSLVICEIFDIIRDGPAFFTTSMLSSIQLTHSNSLRRLELSTNLRLTEDIQSSIASLLITADCLKHLIITWTDMAPAILDSLPSTLRTLEIAAHRGLCPADIVDKLIPRSPHLQNLREVVFKVHCQSKEAESLKPDGSEVLSNASVSPTLLRWPLTLAVGRELTQRRLQKIECKARWESWYPASVESDQGQPQSRGQRGMASGGSKVS